MFGGGLGGFGCCVGLPRVGIGGGCRGGGCGRGVCGMFAPSQGILAPFQDGFRGYQALSTPLPDFQFTGFKLSLRKHPIFTGV